MKKIILFALLLTLGSLLIIFTLSPFVDKLCNKEPVFYSTEEAASSTDTSTAGTLPTIAGSTTTLPSATTTGAAANEPEEAFKLWATTDVNIRQKPSTDSKKLGMLHEGNGITAIGKSENGWTRVIYEENEAYISSSYLTKTEPERAVSSDRITVDPYCSTEEWELIIVNHQREMPCDYVPKLAEVALSGVYLDYRAAGHYNEMYAAALSDGITLTPYSGYRSYARQERNYNNLTNTYMSEYQLSKQDAAAKAATVILPPGTSEHNLGLAMDICGTSSAFSSQKEYKWLTEHAHEYGFILRYTAEKQDITGIIPEPWHWRYVGIEHAAKIKESGLCLEEYVELLQSTKE